MTEIFLFEFKLYVYFEINIMVNFGILLHTLYIECNMHLLAGLCNIGAKSANMHASMVKQYSNAHLLFSNEQLVVIIKSLIIHEEICTNHQKI